MRCYRYSNFCIAVCALLCSMFLCNGAKVEIISLTEDNWKDCLEGQWMIKFYAPWCPACKANDLDYKEFAKWSDDLSIKVATVDITQEPGLSGRFMVSALPTFYHSMNGKFRRYVGSRGAEEMESYVENESWKSEEPISWFRHPDTFQMHAVSWLFKLSLILKNAHETITDEYGYSSWVSYALFGVGTVVTGLTLGLILVCFADILLPKAARAVKNPQKVVEKVEKDEKEDKRGDAATTEDEELSQEEDECSDEKDAAKSEGEASQDEGGSQISSRLSQGWETIQDAEIPEGEVRRRNVEKENAEEAGDASNLKAE